MAIPMPGRCIACGSSTNGVACAMCLPGLRKQTMKHTWQAMAQQQAMGNSLLPYLGNQGAAGIQAMPFGAVGIGGALGSLGGRVVPATPREPLLLAGMKVEDLIGWRIWRVRNGHLWSYSADYAWMPGEVSEGDPGDHDGAGIWAFKDKRRAFQKAVESGGSYVWGSVLLWGHVVEHKDGYRASKARIVSIGGATRDITREALADLCVIHGVEEPAHVSLAAAAKQTPVLIGWNMGAEEVPPIASKPGSILPYSLIPIESEPDTPWTLLGMLALVFSVPLLLWAFH